MGRREAARSSLWTTICIARGLDRERRVSCEENAQRQKRTCGWRGGVMEIARAPGGFSKMLSRCVMRHARNDGGPLDRFVGDVRYRWSGTLLGIHTAG